MEIDYQVPFIWVLLVNGYFRGREKLPNCDSVVSCLWRRGGSMSWDEEIKELREREALAFKMGGEEKVARQHEFNKLTIRERIDSIADNSSFHEVGALAGVGSYDDSGELEAFGSWLKEKAALGDDEPAE